MTPGPTRHPGRTAFRGLRGYAGEAARRGRWRGRRLVSVLLLAAAGLTAVSVGTGWPHADAPVWSVVVGAGAAVAALTLATFVPERGTGRLVDLGCGSCAVAVAMGSVLAVWWLATAPVETWSAGLALGITLAALGKRLTDPVVCAR